MDGAVHRLEAHLPAASTERAFDVVGLEADTFVQRAMIAV